MFDSRNLSSASNGMKSSTKTSSSGPSRSNRFTQRGEWKSLSVVPAIRMLQEETLPNCCVFCGNPVISLARQRFACVRPACRTAYNTTYQDWRRMKRVRSGETQRGTKRKGDVRRWKAYYCNETEVDSE